MRKGRPAGKSMTEAENYILTATGNAESISLHFLENRNLRGKGSSTYASFSGYWKMGEVKRDANFEIKKAGSNTVLPIQSRITAYWPDGSVKWSNHIADFAAESKSKTAAVAEYGKQAPLLPEKITFIEATNSISIDTGVLQTIIYKNEVPNDSFIGKTVVDGRTVISAAKLVFIHESHDKDTNEEVISGITKTETVFTGKVLKTTIEERGPLQAVIKIEGIHESKKDGRQLLPFVMRLTFRLNDPFIHIEHSFTYDGNAQKDFMKGLGIQFETPITGEVYNRHVVFDGDCTEEGTDYFHEASKLLLSWHPRLAPGIYEDQIAGKNLYFNPTSEESRPVTKALASIPAWNSYRIFADSAAHYSITKGTGKDGCCHIKALEGKRTSGCAAMSGEDGGIMVCMKDFWQKYPSSIWFDNLTGNANTAGNVAKTTVWFWSPEAQAMDFRHYDTEGHAGSYYEGYDDFGADPYGIANTNELVIGSFLAHDGKLIPSREEVSAFAKSVQKAPLLVADAKYYHDAQAFGIWSIPDTTSPAKAKIEEQLTKALDFYKKEIEQRAWYGFFDYGDVMHTYDKARHCWRYDMGGYAWQNTELVPTLWLWYSFLRTGREDVFTMAEAMSRHTSEVDIYHIGKFKGLGSRHNVIHWGCPCKEPRVAMAGHHRFDYYLTGDRRFEDIFDIVKDGDFATIEEDPLRYFYDKPKMKYPTHARSGPDWSTYTSNWLTEWERKENKAYEQKIRTGIEDLKKAPLQLVSGNNFEYDPETSHLGYIGENTAGGTHLAICMGGPETWTELVPLLKDDEWEKMLADFGIFYFDTKEEQMEKSNGIIGKREFSLPFMAASIGAYGARYYKNHERAKKIWKILKDSLKLNGSEGEDFNPKQIPYVNNAKLDEIPWVSTNVTSQFCLNAIVSLELIGEDLD